MGDSTPGMAQKKRPTSDTSGGATSHTVSDEDWDEDEDEDSEHIPTISDPRQSIYQSYSEAYRYYRPSTSTAPVNDQPMCGPSRCLTDKEVYADLDTYKQLDTWRDMVSTMQSELANANAQISLTWGAQHIANIKLIHERLAAGKLELDEALCRAIHLERGRLPKDVEPGWVQFIAGAQLTVMVDRSVTNNPTEQATLNAAYEYVRVNAAKWTAFGNYYLHGHGRPPPEPIDLTRSFRPVVWVDDEVAVRAIDAEYALEKAAVQVMAAPFEAAFQGAKYIAGLAVGALEGIIGCIKDALMAIPDLVELAYKLAKLQAKLIAALLSGDLVDTVRDLAGDVVDAVKKLPDALSHLWDYFKRNWYHDDPWERGKFQGKVVGYLLTEIAIAIVSVGTVTSAKIAAKGTKLAKLVKALRTVDTLSDPIAVSKRIGLAGKVDDVGDAIKHAERAARKADTAKAARADLDAALTHLGGTLTGRMAANPFLDPDVWKATYDVARLAIRSGIESFDAFLAALRSSRKVRGIDFDKLTPEQRADLVAIHRAATRAERTAREGHAATKIPEPHTQLSPALAAKRSEILGSLDEFFRTDEAILAVKRLDPDARFAIKGSVVRGTVGNPRKARFGHPFAADNFDLDIFVISDKLPQTKKVVGLPAARDRLNRAFPKTFEGLRGGGSGLSIKIQGSGTPLPDAVMFLGE